LSLLYSPFKGPRWFSSFTKSARLWGIMQESRSVYNETASGLDLVKC
jgi:hypothetical protein